MYNSKPHLFYLLDGRINSNKRLSTQHIAPHHKNKGQSLVSLPNVVLAEEPKRDFLKSDFLVQYRNVQRTKCKTLTSIQVNSINESTNKNKFQTLIKNPSSQISCQNYIKLLGMISSQNQEINETYQSGIKGLDLVVKKSLRPKKFKIKQQKSDLEYEEFKETQIQAKRLTYVDIINDDISSHQSNHPSAYEKSQLQIEITKQELQFGGRKHKLSQYLDKWTLWYQQKHKEEINLLKSSLTVFIDKLSDLSNVWKNPKRVRKLVDKLLKPELVKLIFDNDFHIGLGIHLLLKQFQFKETICTQERQILVFFSLYQDQQIQFQLSKRY